jgi:Protein kinase domain
VLAELAGALDHAHRQGVVHRDIKPDNVLIDDESGRAMLTDFGVAKGTGRGETVTMALGTIQTAPGSIVGTPHYMSPEQASGRADVDGRSDIYSLGVLAYVMLSGHLPFEGTSVADVLTKHMTQEPPPLRSLAPALSDSTAQIVERCLAKDPNKRWADARSLQMALGAPEESALPDELQAAESRGITGVVIAIAFLLILRLLHAPRFALALNAGVIALAYLFGLARLRMEGFSLARSLQTIWREPAWWLFWYPRALRRRGNAWDRIPRAARRVRWWVPAFAAYTVVLFTGPFPNVARRYPEAFPLTILVGFLLMLAFWPILLISARRELMRKGLTAADAHRVILAVPPSRTSFWARPHIAAVLAPSPSTTRSDSPHDYLQSILRTAESLSGPLRPLGADAAVAARQLLASIDDADREIRQLAQNIEPGEEGRLTEKIAALSDDAAPLRSLLEKQLELIRALTSRIEAAKANRNRRIEMLKMLALHLASLRTQSNDATLTDRVQALCEEIRRQWA